MVTIIAATRWPGLHGALIEAAAAAQIDFWGKAGVVGAQFNMYAGMGKGYWSKQVRCLTVQLGRRDKATVCFGGRGETFTAHHKR